MHNFLTPFFTHIELKLVSGDIELNWEVSGQQKKPSNESLIGISHIGNSWYMSFRDKEHVEGGLGIKIIQDYVILILINGDGRDFSGDDSTEKTHTRMMRK